MKKILTVSIASYNVEKYLEKTLDSLINEKYMDMIEVLIINDGSKDKTETIALNYEKKYPNTFTLVSKKNGGHGSTINEAIRRAKGKYLCLLDGDDWVDTDEFYKYVVELEKIDSDIIVNNFNTVNDKTSEIKTFKFEGVEHRKKYNFESLPSKISIMGLSAITYKLDLLKMNNIVIDEKTFYVDMEFISFPIPFINSIIFLPYTIYQYRVNQSVQSVSKKSLLAHINDHTLVTKKLLQFLYDYSQSDLYDKYKYKYIEYVISNMVANQYSVLLLQKINLNNKKAIYQFDDFVKNNAYNIYTNLNQKLWIKLIRKTNHIGYFVSSCLMKIRIR